MSRPNPHLNGGAPDTPAHKNGSWYLPKPAGNLPDFAVCRARRKKKGGFAYCLVSNACACRHATRVDYDLICCHPQRDEIVTRTEAEKNP